MAQKTFPQRQRFALGRTLGLALATVPLILGLLWLGSAWLWQESGPSALEPTAVSVLTSGTVANMESPAILFGPGWTVSTSGADPSEPADPWAEPAGVLTFEYVGTELALELAVGDYWGYIYIMVDGEPANLLPTIAGNRNSQNQSAAYKTFYEPEKAVDGKPVSRWVRVHRARNPVSDSTHNVRIEVWRGWGQTPIRGVAVDALPAKPQPLWPGVALLVIGLGIAAAVGGRWTRDSRRFRVGDSPIVHRLSSIVHPLASPIAAIGLFIITTSAFFNLWWLCPLGLLMLATVSLVRPALWIAALLFGLPFYYSVTLPILPSRAMSLIDVGVLGGVAVCLGSWAIGQGKLEAADENGAARPKQRTIIWVLFAIVGWALVAAFAADQFGVALREWRVLFLSALIFALLLTFTIRNSIDVQSDLWLLIGMWLAGGTVVALIGLWQYGSGIGTTEAEGVRRIQALYDSPNNLALYLERTLAVSAALALFLRNRRRRLIAAGMASIQGVALLLTFSKGAIFLGLPAMFLTLWIGGLVLLRQRGESRRTLWWLAAIALVGVLALTPFLGTERFQRLLDFSQGTGYLRIQLWRSAWQMALDYPLLGVGPDNFLYAFRSGYILPTAWQEPDLNHPHNFFLDWWTRLGIPGLVLGLTFFAFGVRSIWRGIQSKGSAALCVGLLAATVAALAHGLIDVSYALPDLMLVWVFFFGVKERGERLV